MCKIVVLLIFNIWTLSKADNIDLTFQFLADGNGYYNCILPQSTIINESDMISVTVELRDNVSANGCAADSNSSIVFINKLTENNITTGSIKQGDIVPVTLSMSTDWACYMILESEEVYCKFPVHVMSSRIPVIKINDVEISSKPPDDTITDYDAKIEYEVADGELLDISCIYNETTGMNFNYYGFGANENVYQHTEINETTAIHDQVRVTNYSKVNSSDSLYIECVVKRTEYRNAVVRIYLVSDEKTRNGNNIDLTFQFLADENGNYHCILPHSIIINESDMISVTVELKDNVSANRCAADSNSSIVFINKLTENNITTGSIKQGDIVPVTLSMSTDWACYMILESEELYCKFPVHVMSSKIPVIKINDVEISSEPPDDTITNYDAKIEYGVADGELLDINCIYNETTGMSFNYYGLGANESAYQQTEINKTTAIHDQVRVTNYSKVNSSDSPYIECVVKRTEYRNAVVRIYLVSDEKTRNENFFLLMELGFILSMAFIIIILLSIYVKRRSKGLLNETDESNCETISDGFNSVSTERWYNNSQFPATDRCEANATVSNEPVDLSSFNSETVYHNDNSKLLINSNSNNVKYEIYTNSELHETVRSETDRDNHCKYELNDNINNDKEILMDFNFNDNKEH